MRGRQTKQKILNMAGELFAENGFDGTSVDSIANAAGVNKALIYYHFKDKDDIIRSLFQNVMTEVDAHLQQVFDKPLKGKARKDMLRQKISEEIKFLEKHRNIISLLLMETLKSGDKSRFLFDTARHLIEHELKSQGGKSLNQLKNKQQYLVHEFFTGLMPIITFIALQDKWCDHFQCDRDKLLDQFMDVFATTHLKNHAKAE